MIEINPLWFILVLTICGLAVKGLFWLRDVQHAKTGWQAIADEIRRDIKQIFLRLPSTPFPVSSDSPMRLTDFGKELAEKFGDHGAHAWATSLAITLVQEVADLPEFQIDAFAEMYVRDRLDDPSQIAITACAYEAGVNRDVVLEVLRVVLRDALLQLSQTPS